MKKKPAKPPPPGEQALGVMRVRLKRDAEWEDEYERLLFLPIGVEGVVVGMRNSDNVVVCWDYVVCGDKVYRHYTTDVYAEAVVFVRFESLFEHDPAQEPKQRELPFPTQDTEEIPF